MWITECGYQEKLKTVSSSRKSEQLETPNGRQSGFGSFTVHCTLYTVNCQRGFSSAGRAPALQAGGQGFDSLNLHQEEWRARACELQK